MIYDMYDCPNCGKSYEIDYHDKGICNCFYKIVQVIRSFDGIVEHFREVRKIP